MNRAPARGTAWACTILAAMLWAVQAPAHPGHAATPDGHASGLAALKQTLLVVDDRKPLHLPALVTSSGARYAPERLKGHWTVVYFGYTSCPDVCPATLHTLSAVARRPAAGVSAGATALLFVSVDPKHDTPARMNAYLKAYDGRIEGLTGTQEAVTRFSDAIGAGFRGIGQQFDHSTSLFVLDPQGRVAGILLRPADPDRIAADLATLRQAPGGAGHGATTH